MIPSLVYPTHPLRALQLLHRKFPTLFPDKTDFPYSVIVEKANNPLHPEMARQLGARRSGVAAGASFHNNIAIFPANRQQRPFATRVPANDDEEREIRTIKRDRRAYDDDWFGKPSSDNDSYHSPPDYYDDYRHDYFGAYDDDEDAFGGRPASRREEDSDVNEMDEDQDDESEDEAIPDVYTVRVLCNSEPL